MSATWQDRYPQERERVNDSAAAQQVVKSETIAVQTEKVASAADTIRVCAGFNKDGEMLWHDIPRVDETIEWHDDKDDRADRFVTTVEGDLDPFGRPMRQGS